MGHKYRLPPSALAMTRVICDESQAERRRMGSLEDKTPAELEALGLKRCTRCGRIKSIGSAFGTVIRYGRKRPRPDCNACRRIAEANRREADPGAAHRRIAADPGRLARKRADRRRYYARHRERLLVEARTPLGRLKGQLWTARWWLKSPKTPEASRPTWARRVAALEDAIARMTGEEGEGDGRQAS